MMETMLLAVQLLAQAPDPTKVVANVGAWRMTSRINPLDDSKMANGVLLDAKTRVALMIRCSSGEAGVLLVWGRYLRGAVSQVTTRVGVAKAVEQAWPILTDHRATMHPNPNAFIAELAVSDRLVAQAVPADGTPVTVVFALEGVDQVVRAVREACPLSDPREKR